MRYTLLRFVLLSVLVMWGAVGSAQSYLQYADSADTYIGARNWVAAERAILNALRAEPANPSNPLLVTNLGIVRNHLENYSGAIESFDLALARIPKSTVALTGRAEALIALNRRDEALLDLDRAIEVDSMLTLPLTMKGFLLLQENRTEEALPVFNRLIQLQPEEPLSLAGHGDCLASLSRSKEAIESYKKALDKREQPEWRFRAGLLLLDDGDIEGAAEQARLSIAANPRDGNIYILMALIHKKRFENHEAEVASKMARDFGADPELIRHYIGK